MNMFYKLKKKLSLLLVTAMCLSLFSTTAFAAETSDTTVSEDGATTTITTEITWTSPEGEDPAVEGASVTVEATTTDDQGRVVQETGSEKGHETTTTETATSGTVVEDKEPVTSTETGGTSTTEVPGEFETVDSSQGSGVETIAPVFPGGSDITVDLTPGSTAIGTALVDREALAEQLVRPDPEDSIITDPDTGETIGHKTVTVEDVLDEDGTVIGYTSTSTVETSATTVLPDNILSAEPPTMPEPQEPTTDADGVTTSMEVQPVYDDAGNLTGYRTIETRTSSIETAVSEVTLPEHTAENEIIDSDGNVRTEVETLRGTKNTTTLTEVTDVTVTIVTFTGIVGGTVTTTTRTTTTETKRIAASDRTVTAEMGSVTTGEKDGILETTGVQANVAEPDVGQTSQKTDLYHRADKDGLEFDPAGYDFQWLGKYGLESAIRVDAVKTNEDGTTSSSDRWQAHQFVLVDKDGNEHYVYCADFAVSPQAGFRYDMENVEDAAYYDSEAAAHIRAIAQNGYWGADQGAGSLDAVKKMMADAYNNGEIDWDRYNGLATAWGFNTYLTDGMALAATQAAIWTFGNSGDLSIDTEDPFTSYYQATSGKNWRDLDSREWALTKALYDYLVAQTEAPSHKNTLINENNFATNASLTVGQRDEDSGKYDADLTFTLAVMPDTESDDLLVHVVVGGEIVETRRLAGDDSETQYGVIPRSEDGSYTLSGLKLADGVNIDLQLTGTQNIGEGVYLFTSEVSTEPVDYDENGEPVFSSQTFVGIESGRQSVDLSVSLNFTVNEASAEIVTDNTSVTEQKVDTTETSRTDTSTTIEGWTETAVTVTTVQQSDREWEVTWEKNYTYPDPEPEDPVEPDTPDTPEVPDEPEAPAETPPVEDIPDPEIPKADIPTETPDEPLVDIPDVEVPVAEMPDVPTEDIPDTDVPLADVPQTGDDSGMLYFLLAVSLAGLGTMVCLEIRGKKKITD